MQQRLVLTKLEFEAGPCVPAAGSIAQEPGDIFLPARLALPSQTELQQLAFFHCCFYCAELSRASEGPALE